MAWNTLSLACGISETLRTVCGHVGGICFKRIVRVFVCEVTCVYVLGGGCHVLCVMSCVFDTCGVGLVRGKGGC